MTKETDMSTGRWWHTGRRSVGLTVAFIYIGALATLRAQPPATPDPRQALAIGVVIDTHPQQRNVIEFERLVVDALRKLLADREAEVFVVSYSDHTQLVSDWSPVASLPTDAAGRITLDAGVDNNRGAVLNDGVMDGLVKLGSLAEGHRRVVIVIGEGNDSGSATQFSRVLAAAKAQHAECFAFLVANHRAWVGKVRQFGFDLYRLSSGTGGKLYDVRTNPESLDKALKDMLKHLVS